MREAQASVAELKTLLDQMLESNQSMVRMMAKMTPKTSRWSWSTNAHSMNRPEHEVDENPPTLQRTAGCPRNQDRTSTVSDGVPRNGMKETWHTERTIDSEDAGQRPMRDDESIITVRPVDHYQDSEQTENTKHVFTFTFTEDLNNSRPYARLMGRESGCSTTSSAIHTMGWSYLSGTSLADVSQISVLGLPITPHDLWNGHRYSSGEKFHAPRQPFIEASRFVVSPDIRPSKRSSAPTSPFLSPFSHLNNQISNLVRRRSMRSGASGRESTHGQINVELVLIGESQNPDIEGYYLPAAEIDIMLIR